MNIFLTGGTGYLGSVVVEHLVAAGHDVSALARSEGSADRLRAAGARPVRGSLADLETLRESAAAADAVVLVAVDYSMTDEANATELAAVSAVVTGAGSAPAPVPVVYTSTGLVYGFDATQDTGEDAVLPEASAQPVKVAAERIVLDAQGIVPIVVRAGLVFGRGGSGLVTGLIRSAAATGASVVVGDGENSWKPVHVDDLASLYVRALEAPVAGIVNAVGDVPFSFGDLAAAVGELTGTPVVAVPLEVAEQNFGPFARILTTESRMDATKARKTFGWVPSQRSLVEDVRAGSYSADVS